MGCTLTLLNSAADILAAARAAVTRQTVLFRRAKNASTPVGCRRRAGTWQLSQAARPRYGRREPCFARAAFRAAITLTSAAGNGLAGQGVAGSQPFGDVWQVRHSAEAGVVHHQKIAELIVVRVVAGSALHLTVAIQPHLLAARTCRVDQLPVRRNQGVIVNKRNRMMRRQVGAQIADAGGRWTCSFAIALPRL